MRKSVTLILVLTLGACGVEPVGTIYTPPAHDVAIQVGAPELGPNAFSPSDTVISLSSQGNVTWYNADMGFYGGYGGGGTDHRLVSDDGTSFDTGNISPNGTVSATFASPGTYTYHCLYHEGMTGTVTVNP